MRRIQTGWPLRSQSSRTTPCTTTDRTNRRDCRDVQTEATRLANETQTRIQDAPSSSLIPSIRDLQNRGLFDDTLMIVWSGEFGRTPMMQGIKGTIGRDHHNRSMAMWLAGAGVRGGMTYGSTDDLGYAAIGKVCTVHDLRATMLHLLGILHDAFSIKSQGLADRRPRPA
ncbi:MAG: DUF1501 domain-containing protein [Planctomycetaceae bacterium]